MCLVHNKCQTSSATKIKDFPNKDQHLKYLQDRLHEDEQSIQKIEGISDEVVKTWIAQASSSNYLLEDLYRVTTPKMAKVESQLAMHELTVRLLEPANYQTIAEEENAWGECISRIAGPT